MIELLFIVVMGILARLAGGGFGAPWLARRGLEWMPAALFAAPFGVTYALLFDAPLSGCIASIWSYLWMQTGHGVVLPWGDPLPVEQRRRKQTLSPFVDWLADRLGVVKTQADGYSRTVAYCRLFMAVKGFLIGLPVGGVLLAVFWPVAYETGARLRKLILKENAHATAEILSGVFAGIAIMGIMKCLV